MIPGSIILLKSMPLTPNGKIDRNSLPAPEEVEEQEHIAPRNAVEEVLVGIWEEVLRRDRVGVNENFFDLGGHSLLATQVILRVRETFQVDVPLRALFDGPSIAAFAEQILLEDGSKPQIERMAELLVSLSECSEEELEERLSRLEASGAAV